MKKICILIIVILGYFPLLSQVNSTPSASDLRQKNTYQDAVKLANWLKQITITNPNNIKDTIESFLLNNYKWSEKDSLKNPFFDTLKGILNKKGNETVYTRNILPSSFDPSLIPTQPTNSSATSYGSIQSMAINALATFMDQRAKEEVLYYAINNLFSISQDQKSQIGIIFQQLLPKTKDQISSLYNSGQYYYSDFSLLQQTIKLDLQSLPTKLYTTVQDNDIRAALYLGGQVYNNITNNSKITDLINGIVNNDTTIFKYNPDLLKTVRLIQILGNALISSNGSEWIDTSELQHLNPLQIKADPICFLFYGLIYQQLRFQPELRVFADSNIFNKVNLIISIASNLNNLKNTFQIVIPNTTNANRLSNILKLLDSSIGFITNTNAQISQTFNLNPPNANFFNNIQYISTAITDISSGDYVNAADLIFSNLLKSKNISIADIRKLNFFIQLATIKDQTSFTNFMQSYSAPIGSSSLKRTAKFNISLNGYVGINGGKDFIQNSPTKTNKNSLIGGVTAPIGFAFSFPICKKGSITILANLIDLGSLVNARINNDSTNYNNLTFSQFFAPGLGLFYNFKGSPITLGANCTYIQNILNIQYMGANGAIITASNINVMRLSASLLIDIPFFTLTNKPK